ncbi:MULTISPECIES: Hsp33 family molecular chaperone HslO [unclassified Pseudoalteromonas]|uniref:Hsp33 family molecular chaperone HslO n=1 Tax=unclassified Pseudoalteromonas TaxID=194690 RepID=UPI000CF6745C|nr:MULTISPECIES: Hsp33 family molecular chaperone HslO [unclassified Pseudoalteromonas]
MQQDLLYRYIFEQLDVRGELVQVSDAFTQMVVGRDYPDPVKKLLGELFVTTSLLTATLKFQGHINVQIQGDGPVKFAAINGDHEQNMRGVARMQGEIKSDNLLELMGKGHMIITITPVKGERYQGIVPLEHDTLAKCVEQYFAQSEQLRTRLWFATDVTEGQERAAGLFLQVLPVHQGEKSEADFSHLETLSDTVTNDELLNLDAHTVLTRLYHEDNPQLFEPQPIRFKCTCSREKTMDALVNIGQEELLADVHQNGEIVISCHYCLTDYRFNEEQIKAIFN